MDLIRNEHEARLQEAHEACIRAAMHCERAAETAEMRDHPEMADLLLTFGQRCREGCARLQEIIARRNDLPGAPDLEREESSLAIDRLLARLRGRAALLERLAETHAELRQRLDEACALDWPFDEREVLRRTRDEIGADGMRLGALARLLR